MFGTTRQLTTRSVPAHGPLRKSTLMHATALALIALLTIVSYGLLDRALHMQRSLSSALDLTQRQRMLSQRIAGLSGQYALGAGDQRAELGRAIDALSRAEQQLVGGEPARGLAPVRTDPALRTIYFGGRAPLDGAVTKFAMQARRVATLAPHDPQLVTTAAPLFAAAQKPLLDGLETAIRMRESRTEGSFGLLRELGILTMLALLGALVAEAAFIVRPLVRQALRYATDAAELARVATTDPLTGVLNKRSFHDRGTVEIHKAKRYNRPLSLLMIDPDQFTAINESHGEVAGDTLLKALTETLYDGTRTTDLVGRVGDEGFAVLLPETDRAGAELIAERLRQRISDLTIPINRAVVSCTVSIGVAAAEKGAAFFTPTFKRADDALYEAKIRGRNRVYSMAA